MRRSSGEERCELSERASASIALVREHHGSMSPIEIEEGGRAVMARLDDGRSVYPLATVSQRFWASSSWAKMAPLALAVSGVLFFGAHYVWHARHEPMLSCEIAGHKVREGDAIEATSQLAPKLQFSDGTEVALAPGTHGHVKDVTEHGARIAIEEGRAQVDVVHLPGARWLFEAGPFVINVKGTSFQAGWTASEARLDVRLDKGSVAVNGPLVDEAIMLHAGQQLTIRLREKEVMIREISAMEAAPREADQPKPATETVEIAAPKDGEPDGATAQMATGKVSANANSNVLHWATDLKSGNFEAILQAAERRGLTQTLGEVSSDDLAALADAARYSRRADIARRALSTQRHRFAHSRHARDAAFLLGRLEETAKSPVEALSWYVQYLDESPQGTYASEALGRKMTVLQRLYGDERAVLTAEEYVRRFPSGTYAAAAQALIRRP